jgi:hypothetical protein
MCMIRSDVRSCQDNSCHSSLQVNHEPSRRYTCCLCLQRTKGLDALRHHRALVRGTAGKEARIAVRVCLTTQRSTSVYIAVWRIK